jgi:hypothetical protein|tara:strand:+ start:41 stop:292 length:252 start_codon:yes stop_codon:yes gene_type:complete
LKRLLNRPTKADSIDSLNRELEKVYDLINDLTLRSTKFDDTKTSKGKAGDIRVSRNSSGEVVLEIRADDDWYVSTEIFSKMTR